MHFSVKALKSPLAADNFQNITPGAQTALLGGLRKNPLPPDGVGKTEKHY
jgi:hypothetical protein